MNIDNIPSVAEVKAYAKKKGYRYAHLFYSKLLTYGLRQDKKWQMLMDRHEAITRDAVCYGRHVIGLYAPEKWEKEAV